LSSPPLYRAGALIGGLALALIALGCGSSSHAAAASSSPSCLPTKLVQSARLAGVGVDVSPAPGSVTANPATQISFLGVPAAEIRAVSVIGGRSGPHTGALKAYSQGDGASFVPDHAFTSGERVVVRATIGPGAGKPVEFAFTVDTPYPTASVGDYANPPASADEYQTFDTLPTVKAPLLSVTVPDRDPAAGDIFTTNGPGPGAYGPLIYTPQGQLVWFDQLSGGLTAEDLNVQTYRGQRDLTFWQGRVLSLGFGQGEDVVMNSRYQTVATVHAGNGLLADLHEFQIAPDNVAYITAYNPIRCDLSSVGGARNDTIIDPSVQEIDLGTGLVRWEWHSLDHIPVTQSQTSPPKGFPWDWFHLNSIDPEPNGDILISARNTWALYQLAGASGQIIWRLGGLDSSFTMGPGTKTYWQHDARMQPDGEITLYDDGDPGESQSRAIRIALDLRRHAARLVSALTHPNPPLLAASQGNVQTLADGNTVVGYGGVPQISEYTPSGSLLFDAHLPYDMIFYRAFRFAWSGQPASPPVATANLNNTGGETIVHMSWNGATAVSSWRILAGSDARSLQAQATVRSAGFESSAILPRTFGSAKARGYVAVQALSSSGEVLGTSATVAVGTYAALFATGRNG
jgi:hypothetical protein